MKKTEKQNSIFQALSDPTRRQILKILKKDDKTPSELIKEFNITKPSLSHHLDILKRADLVVTERKGKNIVYSLNISVFEDVTAFLLDFFEHSKK